MKENNFNMNKCLSEIEATLQKDIDSFPQGVLESILDRAYKDTDKIFKNGDQNNFKQITYAIYRAYILGMMVERHFKKQNKIIKNNDNSKIIKFKAK